MRLLLLLLCGAASTSAAGGDVPQNILMWAELPAKAAAGTYAEMSCFYERLTNVLIASHAPGSMLRYDKVVIRVEDPLVGANSPNTMNNWVFDPYQAGGHNNQTNPFATMLRKLRSSLGSDIHIYLLPSLHVGNYYRWCVMRKSYTR